jgi:hypothetical protein
MMIFTVAVVLCTLLSSTQAASPVLRQTQVMSLGETFLATAKNYTTQSTTTTKSGSFSLELEASAIKPLGEKFDQLCNQQGSVSSKSQSGNDTVTTSYNLGCSLTTKEKYDVFEAAAIALLKGAQDNTTSYTFNFYTSSFGDSYSIDPRIYLAQQKALETLMAEADTIEEVMLVYTSWQSVVTSYVSSYPTPTTSTISVTLSQKYEYVDYPIPFAFNETIDD